MKIALVRAPNTYNIKPKEQQGLGILYIASVLKELEHDVNLIDLCDKKFEECEDLIPEADIYGFTATFLDLYSSHKIGKLIKKKYPYVKLVIGGYGPTASPEFIDPSIFDSRIIGEGEKAIVELVSDVENNQPLKKVYQSPLMTELELENLPFPARDLLDYQGGDIFIKGSGYNDGPSTGLFTSRGCPYNCSFCASKALWSQRVRFRSVTNIMKEMRHIIDHHHIFNIKLQDDTFILKADRVFEFCKEMKKLNEEYSNKIKWRCYGGRVNLISEEMLIAMKESGCKEIDFGNESGDQDVLDLMQKQITVEGSIESIQLANKVGIFTRAFMMIGLPGTTKKTAKKDIDFYERAKPTAVNIAIFTPYPGSDIWKYPDKFGIEILSKPKDYTELHKFEKYNMHYFSKDPDRTRKSIIRIKGLSCDELEEIKGKIFNYSIEKNYLKLEDYTEDDTKNNNS